VRFANEINRLFPGAIKPGSIDEDDLLAQISALQQSRATSNFPESTDPKENDPILVVEALKHWYMRGTPQEHPALTGVDMAVKRGSAHGLIGRTGAGKSTLLQHLNGLLRPQSGTVVIDSKSMNDPRIKLSDVIQKAGLVMQNPEMQFFEHFVGDEIAYGPRTIGCDQPLAERVFWAMEMVGLDFDNFKDREIHTLSGGEKRKVALASLLAIKPSILLLDEPLASLDPRSHDEIRAKLGDLRKEGITLVLSSHNMEDIGFLTHRTTVLSDGASIVTKKTSELMQDESILNQASLKLPFSMKVARGLSMAGLNVSQDICTADGLIRHLRTIRREYDE
jgi:energy-coupling factor transport system ATP-binding protein